LLSLPLIFFAISATPLFAISSFDIFELLSAITTDFDFIADAADAIFEPPFRYAAISFTFLSSIDVSDAAIAAEQRRHFIDYPFRCAAASCFLSDSHYFFSDITPRLSSISHFIIC
jgi:hypothetical protein